MVKAGSADLIPALRAAIAALPSTSTSSAWVRSSLVVALHTSGSTGEPKTALLPFPALLHSARATLDRIGGPGRWLLALPTDRVAGLQVVVRSLLGAAQAGVVAGDDEPVRLGNSAGSARFEPAEFVAATARLGSAPSSTAGSASSFSDGSASGSAGLTRRYVSLVPTQLLRLLDAGPRTLEALRSYDTILLGAAAAHPALLRRAREAGLAVVTTYGMTETCGGCVYDGVPLDGVEVDLDPTGRIRIGGPVVFAGYAGRPDLTAEALVEGRLVTQDLGRIDESGRLDVLGRVDDVVVSGGVNVPLPAVESTLGALTSVAEVAVVGVPDEVWGTRVVAFVVPRRGVETPTLQGIRAHVAAVHPKAYAPRRVLVVDELPMLASGKPDRAKLRALASAGPTAQGRPARTQAS